MTTIASRIVLMLRLGLGLRLDRSSVWLVTGYAVSRYLFYFHNVVVSLPYLLLHYLHTFTYIMHK